ncbi:MAG TPA: hypothetical protein VM388_02195 [Acidimicrobiales bacterium]|jgi:hypothetical protein|nr:hypothetical protein [Acidimicrobiales bacterium]
MPALPWIRITTAEPGAELTAVATRLPLRSHRHIPAFLRWTMRIRGQLAGAEGLVGYSLDAHLLGKTFWTVSAWTSQAVIEEFVGQDPHASSMAAIRPNMQRPAFLFWTVAAEDLPIRWGDVRSRMGGQG